MPNGFRPYVSLSGRPPVVQSFTLVSNNTAVGIGTPVTFGADGVNIATAGDANALCGIAAEAKAASAGGTIKVWADPNQLFIAQTDDGTGTATTAAAVDLNINFIGTGVTNGIGTSELDESSANTNATYQFKIIKLADEINGKAVNAYGEFNRFVVAINNHQFKGHTGTAGV